MAQNLDAEINKLGFEIANEACKKNILTFIDKSLGVLSNDGVYAYYVFCLSKGETYTNIFIEKPFKKMKPFIPNNGSNTSKDYFTNLSENLHDLLFFKDVLERALIYARYHAKAFGDSHE